ncbi:MAG TPA: BamA/TamA family outer membrane protein [Ignavibacteriaceae bacterium]|nr:BamA/TamA family outer membrane protein [Ignavibacteriaceae bacterium]
MLHRVKYLFLSLLILSPFVYSQTINNIEISGNRIFSRGQVLNWSGVNIGEEIYPGIIDSIKSREAVKFSEYGYFHSSFEGTEIIESEDTGKVDLIINIAEGGPTYLKNIFFNNASHIDSLNILPSYDFLTNNIFNRFELEASISSSITYYENNGFPFSRISISSINFYSDSSQEDYYADIYLDLDHGKPSVIDEIEITGNTKTKRDVILRELRVTPGEEYSQNLVEEIPYRLNRLGFFQPVQTPEFYINSRNKGVLSIKVKERQTNNFDGILGYIPGNTQNESGYFTGLANVSLRNLFGTGRAAAIRWQKLNRSSQELELKYLEPWLFGFPINITAGLFQRKQDTTYVQRNINLSLQYLATEDISASFTFSTESIIPSDTDTLSFTVYNSSTISTGLNFKYDTRDDPYSSTKGLLFISAYSFSRKKINGPQKFISPGLATDIDLQRIELEFKIYYLLFQRQVIVLGLNGKELRGSNFDLSDLYRLGGTNSLRGYREDQFLGSRILWSNLEYRFLLSQRSFGFLFFDTGYYFRKAEPQNNIYKAEDFKIGYGLGINLETSLGVIGVSFGFGKGDSFSDGKIHFGIVNEF